jgi:hypothetical protein
MKQLVNGDIVGREHLWHRLQTMLRRRRFRFVRTVLAALPSTSVILDVGGTQAFWEQVEALRTERTIVLYNVKESIVSDPTFSSVTGDARAMHQFDSLQFDFVFSNSVIEHVGSYEQQQQMAKEIQRVGRSYYVQTPYRYFPIEPHVLMPFFQFFPFAVQCFLLVHVGSPWGWRLKDRQEAEAYLRSIRLLTMRELRALFPDAQIYKEKFLGFTKSLIAYRKETGASSFSITKDVVTVDKANLS